MNKLLCYFGFHRYITKNIESIRPYSSISYEYPECRICGHVHPKHNVAIGLIKWDQIKGDNRI